MPNITQTKSGKWLVDVSLNGKRVRQTFATKEEAQELIDLYNHTRKIRAMTGIRELIGNG